MNARRRSGDDGDVAVLHPRKRAASGRNWLVPAGVIAVLLVGGSYAVWRQVGDHVLSGSQYRIDPEQIAVSPKPPAWVHGDIKAEVIHDARLDGPLSLLDPDLTVRMASAFAAHPWVARVERVSKHYPSGLNVVLVYRRPAAMVEVRNGTAALPVDTEGVLLPTRDFTPDDAERYPRIGEIHTAPTGSPGTAWGDSCVTGAAQVAAVLAQDWKNLDLFRIVPAERKPGRTGAEYTFALLTHSGTKVLWGRAPSTDLPGELPAADKIAQLRRYAAQNKGSLDDPEGRPHEIVIGDSGALLSKPRPRVESLPTNEE